MSTEWVKIKLRKNENDLDSSDIQGKETGEHEVNNRKILIVVKRI